MVECQIACLSALDKYDYRPLTVVEMDVVRSNYKNADSLDDASLFVLYYAHRAMLNTKLYWKNMNYFLSMVVCEEDENMLERMIYVVGSDTENRVRTTAITKRIRMPKADFEERFCNAIDFNELVLLMDGIKPNLGNVLVASVDSNFIVTERFLFDACKVFVAENISHKTMPKIYQKMDALAVNHERILNQIVGRKREKKTFLSGGIKYHVCYG